MEIGKDNNPKPPRYQEVRETYALVVDACNIVRKTFGAGFLEEVYHKSLYYELLRRGVKVDYKPRILLHYLDHEVGHYEPDLVVNDWLIIELKACSGLTVEHSQQLVNYLNGTGREYGFLINFGTPLIQTLPKTRKYGNIWALMEFKQLRRFNSDNDLSFDDQDDKM